MRGAFPDPLNTSSKVIPQQTKMLFEQSYTALGAVFINAIFFVGITWPQYPREPIVIWAAAIAFFTLARFLLIRQWSNGDPASRSELISRRNWFTFGVFISGALWGSTAVMFGSLEPGLHQVAAVFILAGMTAGSVVAYCAYFPAIVAFLVPALLPTIFSMLFSDQAPFSTMGTILGFYLFLMIWLGMKLNKKALHSINLQFENQDLVVELKREIEKRKARDNELQKSREQLNLALESSAAATWHWYPEIDKVIWDGCPEAILGEEPAVPQSLSAFLSHIHPDDRMRVSREIVKASRHSIDLDTSYRVILPDDSWRFVSHRAQHRPSCSDRLSSLSGICVDVTAQKQRELLREQCDRAHAEAKSKSSLLANASHEIRTPVSAMSGFAGLLAEEKSLSSKQKGYADVIRRNASHLLSLIEDLLQLSSVHANRSSSSQKEKMSLHREILSCIDMISNDASAKGLRVEFMPAPGLPEFVESHPQRFRQILLNLLNNSVKFTRKGSIQIRASIKEDSLQSLLSVSVIDTGEGISSQNADRIFDPFVRESCNVRGSGLGLALSREIAESLDGKLELLASVPGSGSEFRFQIPVRVLRNLTLVKNEDKPPRDWENRTSNDAQSKKRILVAEDSDDLRSLVGTLLKPINTPLKFCTNGKEVIREVRHEDYDIILMDIKMPIMDGYAATKHLREMGYKKKIIACTAYSSEPSDNHYLAYGFDDCIHKPFDKDALISTLAKHLS